MNPYWLLPLVVLVCAPCAYVSYTEFRHRVWAWYLFAAASLAVGLGWTWSVRRLTPAQVYVFSLWWDSLVTATYYSLPILMAGVRPSAGVVAGTVLVIAGLVTVKVCG